MKKSSETLGLKVMGIREGLENGIAQDFMIDAAKRTVEYLILKDNNGYGFRAIATGDILGIGADYIIGLPPIFVPSTELVEEAS